MARRSGRESEKPGQKESQKSQNISGREYEGPGGQKESQKDQEVRKKVRRAEVRKRVKRARSHYLPKQGTRNTATQNKATHGT
jgi:hypothetical protein